MTKEEAINEITKIINLVDDFEKIIDDVFPKIEDRNLKIYLDKKYKGLNNSQLEVKYGIGKRQINKICKKIKNTMI